MSDGLPPPASVALPPRRRRWVRPLTALLGRHPGLYLWILQRWRPADRERFAYVALVRRGDVVIDVGANLGLYTILFSDLAGPHGRVHAFEPVAATFAQLSDVVAHDARARNIRLNQSACTNDIGACVVHVPAGDGGQASLVPHRTGSWSQRGEIRSEAVAATTLDEYVGAHGLDRVDLIKCDVEGAELRVLEGASACLARHQPLLSLEVSTDWTRDFGYDSSALVGLLRTHGYDWFALVSADAARLLEPGDAALTTVGRTGAMLLCGATARHGDRLNAYWTRATAAPRR